MSRRPFLLENGGRNIETTKQNLSPETESSSSGRGGKWRISIDRVNTSHIWEITESRMRHKWAICPFWFMNPTKGALAHEMKTILLFSKVLVLPHSSLCSTLASLLLQCYFPSSSTHDVPTWPHSLAGKRKQQLVKKKKKRHIDQWNRIEKPRNKPMHMQSINFWQGCKEYKWGKVAFY